VAEAKTEPLYNPNDRFGDRDGGPYADQVEAIQAEKRRAGIEGREPDYDNLQPTAGIPAVTAAQLAVLNGTTGFSEPTPIGETAVVEVEEAKITKASTDEQKIEAAQTKALAKDETPIPSQEVAKTVETK